MGTTYWGQELDLARSHDIIDRMTIQLTICCFPIVSHWNWASVLNRFWDICVEIYWGNDLDLSGYV